MKFFNTLVIAIVLTAFVTGCSSAPKVVDIGKPPTVYGLGQEPRKIEFAYQGRIFKENAKVMFQDALGHQRVMTLEEYAHHERTNRLGILDREQGWAKENLKHIKYTVQPTVNQNMQQAAPPASTPQPAVQPQSSNRYQYDQRGASLQSGRQSQAPAAPVATYPPQNLQQPVANTDTFGGFMREWGRRFVGKSSGQTVVAGGQSGGGGVQRQAIVTASGNFGPKITWAAKKIAEFNGGHIPSAGGRPVTVTKEVINVSAALAGGARVNSGLTGR